MRTAIASAATVAGLLASLATSPPLSPAAPPPAGPSSPVRIALESRAAADGGTTYAITVRNTSGADAPHGRVTQLLPESLEYVSASPRARTNGQQVTWRITLPAGTSRVLTVTAAPDRTERDARDLHAADAADPADASDGVRAPRRPGAEDDARDGAPASATTVCFQGGTRGEWLTCTSADDEWSPEPWVSSNKVYAVGSAAAALLVGTAGIVILRRRRSRDTEDDGPRGRTTARGPRPRR
ncbi:DUF11 domain-containing protein [Streptomyces sp. WMMC500]|uniref:DUF11 domain-containing protein n=1 Tax=Streptomyces sp. WMMC500 TaxID=3015154 RepID=UPI00248BF406|nr:DUF11 domain-containing protein [Streptomyces sp. WMMC500]WBB59776.1 DUF11 domain-containing protein [Streptomyces sp. WMMC500]